MKKGGKCQGVLTKLIQIMILFKLSKVTGLPTTVKGQAICYMMAQKLQTSLYRGRENFNCQ